MKTKPKAANVKRVPLELLVMFNAARGEYLQAAQDVRESEPHKRMMGNRARWMQITAQIAKTVKIDLDKEDFDLVTGVVKPVETVKTE